MLTKHHAVKSAHLPRPRVLRPSEAAEVLGIGRSTLWRYAKMPGFPCKIRLGDAACGWLESELLSWIESRKVEG